MSAVLSVENVAKQYRLGLVGSGTLREDLVGWWYRMRGLEDPTLMIGEENDRTKTGDSNYVWALRDINFEVQQGEVLGIIGKNGAGKSTLLKLLSRVTAPTTGSIKAKGRIASLLEVGTGFHPELTGRENIFLNGAIMGMKRHEITRKLDEIVAFAGVERYLDTPVKRYSSGMYVRLAFAVAAHLDPEILIIDEVLAVGDAEFQKKALGKMKDVSSGEGRTVLFVSHNMASVKTLCPESILLVNGKIQNIGNTNDIILEYHGKSSNGSDPDKMVLQPVETDYVSISQATISAKGKTYHQAIDMNDAVCIKLSYNLTLEATKRIDVTLRFRDDSGDIFMVCSTIHEDRSPLNKEKGEVSMEIPPNFFNSGDFSIDILIVEDRQRVLAKQEGGLAFTVIPGVRELGQWMGKAQGLIQPRMPWISKEIEQ